MHFYDLREEIIFKKEILQSILKHILIEHFVFCKSLQFPIPLLFTQDIFISQFIHNFILQSLNDLFVRALVFNS